MTSKRSSRKVYFENLRAIQASPDGTSQSDGVSPDVAEEIGYKHPSDLPAAPAERALPKSKSSAARRVGRVATRPEQRLEPYVPLDEATIETARAGLAEARQAAAASRPAEIQPPDGAFERILDAQRPPEFVPAKTTPGSPDQVA
jgi:hypothetical protein